MQTGAIFVTTEPGEVSVYVSEKLKGTTGAIFKKLFKKNILPKTYLIELKKDGYYAWKKNLEIKERLTTEIRDVYLLPQNTEKQLLSEKNLKNFYISPDNKKIAYFTTENKIGVLNLSSNSDLPILDTSKIDGLLDLSWSDNSKNIYLRIQEKKEIFDYVWIDDSQQIIELQPIIGIKANPSKFKWNAKDSNQIFFIDSQKNSASLNKINLTERTINQKILENLKNYFISGDGIYFMDEPSKLIFETDFDGRIRKQFGTDLIQNGIKETDNYKIFVLPQTIALIDGKNNCYLLNSQSQLFEKIGENIIGVNLSDDLKKLLYWGQNEIWVLYLEDYLIQPIKFKGDKDLIIRLSFTINDSFWCPDAEHILISSQNSIKITEIDSRDVRNTIDFLNGSLPYFSKTNKKIYYIDGEKLYSARL